MLFYPAGSSWRESVDRRVTVDLLIHKELNGVERSNELWKLEDRINKLGELLGYAVSTMSPEQQRDFAAQCGWEVAE